MTTPSPLQEDLERLLGSAGPPWAALGGARLLLTGGTGFFGAWLLESLLHAEDRLELGIQVTVLTRDAGAFQHRRPRLAGHRAVTVLQGDVLDLLPLDRPFTHVVHAATPVARPPTLAASRLLFDTIVEGTRRTLEVARRAGARRFLLVSSGAVYGRQPPGSSGIPEDHPGGPDPLSPASAYGEGKRAAELLCGLAAAEGWVEPVVARGFAFSGPYLPLDGHFAIGNFVRDALAGGPIRVAGDGTAIRSYLYGGDLAAWLWTLLLRGQAGQAYNVGSERALSIGELAHLTARVLQVGRGVRIDGRPVAGRLAERYVPSTLRARRELSLGEAWTLEEALVRMADLAAATRDRAAAG